MNDLIFALREHSVFGFVFSAYFTRRRNEHFIEIKENISFIHSDDQKKNLSKDLQSIIVTIDSYSDHNLSKIFGKKKTTRDFLRSVSSEDVKKRIRPFIEKRLYSVIEKLLNIDVDIYLKRDDFSTFHEDDKLNLLKDPAKTIFNIEKEEEGTKYYLSIKHRKKKINLNGRKGIIVSNEPCALVLNSNIYLFEDIDGKKLLPFFEKTHISIPKSSEKKWFKTFAVNAIKKYEVNATGFSVKEKVYEAKAVLKLEKNWRSEYVFILYFKYGNDIYSAGKNVETKMDFDDQDFEFVKSIRNESWETEIIKHLTETGLILQADNSYKVTNENAEDDEQRYKTIQWLTENKNRISEAGIEIEQDLYNKKYITEQTSLEIKLSQKKDWFDIYGIVRFGKFEIPFIQLRKNILNENREFILPDKSIALIPYEWFAKYGDIFLYGKESDKSIKINKANYSAVERSELKGISNKFKKSIKKLLTYESFNIDLPKDIRAELRPYQKEGLKWMYFLQENNFGGCLADDMGLGKTLQTITLLQKTIDSKKNNPELKKSADFSSPQLDLFSTGNNYDRKASLIVMPVSLIHNWKNEIKKFAPNLKVLTYQGPNRHRNITRFNEYDIILSGYALVRNDIDLIKKQEFLYVILDESQFIKNPESKIYKAVLELESDYKLVLTGTPIENSLQDLWSQLNFLNNGMLGSKAFFNQEFLNPVEKKKDEIQEAKLKQLISPFILRRTKDEVAKDLPPLTEQVIWCHQEDDQKSFYESEKSKIRNKIIELIDSGEKKSLSVEVLGALTKLRQISNHPLLVDKNYKGESGKFREIIRNFENIASENHKVLIFSSFVKHLDLLATYFSEKKLKYSMLTGQTKKREQVIKEFQNDPDNKVFLISIKAGGTGLNLTEADYVFIIDPWWNPAVEKQAVNRAHRIGQDKKVMVYRYICKDTIEEKIAKLQEKKSKLAETFINSNNPLSKLSNNKLLELFK